MTDKKLLPTTPSSDDLLVSIFRLGQGFAKEGSFDGKLHAAHAYKFLITKGQDIVRVLENYNQKVIEALEDPQTNPEQAREIFDNEWNRIDYEGFKKTEKMLRQMIKDL